MSAAEKEVLRRLPTKLRGRWLSSADEDVLVVDEKPRDATTERTYLVADAQNWPSTPWSLATEYYTLALKTTAAARYADDYVFVAALTDTEPSSPFDALVAEKAARAKATISATTTGLAAIGRRLDSLVDLAKEEYPATEIPDVASLASAIGFFSTVEGLSKPLLGLTSSGNVWAEWFKRRDRQDRVALEFRKNGSITLAATFRDPTEPLRRSSVVHGNLSAKVAADRLRADITLSWVMTARERHG